MKSKQTRIQEVTKSISGNSKPIYMYIWKSFHAPHPLGVVVITLHVQVPFHALGLCISYGTNSAVSYYRKLMLLYLHYRGPQTRGRRENSGSALPRGPAIAIYGAQQLSQWQCHYAEEMLEKSETRSRRGLSQALLPATCFFASVVDGKQRKEACQPISTSAWSVSSMCWREDAAGHRSASSIVQFGGEVSRMAGWMLNKSFFFFFNF